MKINFLMSFLFIAILTACSPSKGDNVLDTLDPKDPETEEQLEELDNEYEVITGKKSHIPVGDGNCYQYECRVYALVNKDMQTLDLFIDGVLEQTWAISSGTGNYETPDFDQRPDGRIYDAYTSTRYPGGNYKGLGNMPYAVFIEGGYAIHGTGESNWEKLGEKASHGCIRLHPDHAKIFNRLVRDAGIENVWITVE